MAVRTTMEYLINTLRGFTNAGTADYTIAGISYFTDDQLQTILDRNVVEIREAKMKYHPLYDTDGELEYKEYSLPVGWFEKTDGGTAHFIVTNGIGAVIASSGWSADYENGKVTFTADTGGSVRAVTGKAFDIYGAAADVWRQKANQYATMINFSTDNHTVKRDHIVAQCEAMAKRYENMSMGGGVTSVTTIRGDANV